MKALLAISLFLVLCLAFAPASGAAVKAHKKNSSKGTETSGTEAAAPVTITPSSEKSRNAEEITPEEKDVAPAEEKVAPAAKKAAKPAPEKPEGFHVKVQDGLLSVNVKDQKFGDVISLIANSAGFDVDLSNDVFDMKLSTRFKEIGLQRGILRLIFLIDQKNYSIHYRPDGSIKTLEVHGDQASGQSTLTGTRPATANPAERTPQPRRPQMTRPPSPPAVVVPDRNRRRRISTPPPEKTSEEPVKEEEVLELDYRHFTPLSGQGGGDEGPADEPAPEPTSGPAPEPTPGPTTGDCSDDPACNVIPEGPIPPVDELLNAPVIP